MSGAIPLEWYICLASALFCIGILGVLLRRNTMMILMCIELMLNAVSLLFVAASSTHHDLSAQVSVFFIMIVAAAEVSIGLVLFAMIYKQNKSIDIEDWSTLKG